MKYTIAHLQEEFNRQLDEFCLKTERGDEEGASDASLRASDYLQSLRILKVAQELKKMPINVSTREAEGGVVH